MMDDRRSQSRFLGRHSPIDLEVARAEGSYLYDARDRRYIDFLMGWCVGNLGWAQQEIRDTIREYVGPDYVYPGFTYGPWEELAGLLVQATPRSVEKCFRATGGSEAVELAMQAAMLHTGRRKFLSIEGSYHGNTLGPLSIGAADVREKLPNLLPNCHWLAPPLNVAALGRLETRLKRRDVAAFIMEAVVINLGVLIPDHEFMTGAQELCRRYGTLFVIDEVATGFGRTGRLFASEHFEIQPDILCLAKAVTGGCAPLGAMVASAEVGGSMEEHGEFYSTYGWHPLSTAAAITNLGYLLRNRVRLMKQVADTSEYFRDRLAAMPLPEPPRVRIRGLAIGVDLFDGDYAHRIQERCRDAGLILVAQDTTLLLLPALDIDRSTAEAGLQVLESCL